MKGAGNEMALQVMVLATKLTTKIEPLYPYGERKEPILANCPLTSTPEP